MNLLYFLLALTTLLMLFFILRSFRFNRALQELHEEAALLQEQKSDIESRCRELEIEFRVLSTKYEHDAKAAKERFEMLKSAKEELSREFKVVANEIFEDKSIQFGATSKEQLELLLKPFREQIANFANQSKEQFINEAKERHLLKDELYRLAQMNEKLSQDALNLTKALKGENKTQGNWGEIVLERILEESGLREGSEYELQATLKDQESKTYRPDVIIHMPKGRDIIIDSKVSLSAYERFMSAQSDETRVRALKEHIASISTHIKSLSEKRYEKLEGVNSLDFVLLFMPIEGAFLLALEHDGEFFKRAYESNILVVSPSTLLVTLRTIEHIWRTQRQQEHAQKIASEAEGMLEKLALFVEEMQNLGNILQKAHQTYDNSMKRLSSGRGNVIKRAQNIVELGVKPKKEIPLLSNDEE